MQVYNIVSNCTHIFNHLILFLYFYLQNYVSYIIVLALRFRDFSGVLRLVNDATMSINSPLSGLQECRRWQDPHRGR